MERVKRPRPPHNPEDRIKVLAEAVFAIKELGEPINPKALEVHHRDLYDRIRNLPGGWDRVVTVAGYIPEEEIKGRRRLNSLVSRNAS